MVFADFIGNGTICWAPRPDPRYIFVCTVQVLYIIINFKKIFYIAPSLPSHGRKSCYGPECKNNFKPQIQTSPHAYESI